MVVNSDLAEFWHERAAIVHFDAARVAITTGLRVELGWTKRPVDHDPVSVGETNSSHCAVAVSAQMSVSAERFGVTDTSCHSERHRDSGEHPCRSQISALHVVDETPDGCVPG